MVDIVQIVLVIVVVVITAILSFIGVQTYLILKEVRESVRKTNKILDDAQEISRSVAKPISSLSDVITGASGLTSLLGWFLGRKHAASDKEEDE